MSEPAVFVPRFPDRSAMPQHSWIDALSARQSFVPDPLHSGTPDAPDAVAPDENNIETAAFARGFEQGRSEALAEAIERSGQEARERRKLGSALRRMDETLTERLGEELSHTIAALCEVTLAPLTLDTVVLQSRCHDAAAMLGQHHADRVLYMAPQDIAALDPEFAAEWTIHPDVEMEPGSLRIEQDGGGVADGPAEWRAAIRQAVGLC